MTTVSPDDATIRFTDTIKTRASHIQPAEQTDWSNWERWMAGHKSAVYRDIVCEIIDPLEQRLRTLELELAQTRGALDVLRGRGAPGTFRAKGTYDAKAVYNSLDVVTKDSSSFVALRDSPGTCPGDGWQMIACGGKRGPAGERGPAGPAGPAPRFEGARFSSRGMTIESNVGSIPVISSVGVDSTDFSIKLHAADGSTLRISLLPLFQAYNAQTTGP